MVPPKIHGGTMNQSISPIISPSGEALLRAGTILSEGGLVAFPTETVYGLGANACNDQAVAAIFEAKNRPQFNPLIVHVADVAAAEALVVMDERAHRLAAAFWPGPLTLVLPRVPDCPLSYLVSAGLSTVAVRIPAHPVALDVLRAAAVPVAAPSANPSGAVSPTTARHVAEGLAGRVSMILDGGSCRVGLESTVLDISGPQAVLLRPGGVTRADLEPYVGAVIAPPKGEEGDVFRSPGMLLSHYAPSLPVRLNAVRAEADEAFLGFGPADQAHLNLSPQGSLLEAAANLFAMLRTLDKPEFRRIAVMSIPETGLGEAINDRLRRAAAPRPGNTGRQDV